MMVDKQNLKQVDPDENEGVEYGDGGISTTARHGNTSPTNGVSQHKLHLAVE